MSGVLDGPEGQTPGNAPSNQKPTKPHLQQSEEITSTTANFKNLNVSTTVSRDEQKDEEADDDDCKRNLIINYLPPTLTEGNLATLFSPYGSLENCKIVIDLETGRSRGYGFVKYHSKESAVRAAEALNGYSVHGKRLKVAYARKKCKEIQNANLYITNIPDSWSSDKLRSLFESYGEIVECRILYDEDGTSRGVGFVRLDTHNNALAALNDRDGYIVEKGMRPINVKLAQRRNVKQHPRSHHWGNRQNQTLGGDDGMHANYSRRGRQNQHNNNQYNKNEFHNANINNVLYGDENSYLNQHSNHHHNKSKSHRRKKERRNYNNTRGDYNLSSHNTNGGHGNNNDKNHSHNMNSRSRYGNNNNNGNNSYNYGPYSQQQQQTPMATPFLIDPLYQTSQQAPYYYQHTGAVHPDFINTPPYSEQTIAIHNIPSYYTPDHLIALYAPFGPIKYVNVMPGNSGHRKKTGVVTFLFHDDAQKAVQDTNGRSIESKKLKVVFQ